MILHPEKVHERQKNEKLKNKTLAVGYGLFRFDVDVRISVRVQQFQN